MSAKNFAQEAVGTVEDWLRLLAETPRLSPAHHKIIQSVIRNPQAASYASSSTLAAAAGLNVATVTRTAQILGFAGWPDWRQAIRTRYLGTRSAAELTRASRSDDMTGRPFDDTLNRHLQQVAGLRRSTDRQKIRACARAVADADRRIIIGSGSFAALAHIMAHHATLVGYRCEVATDDVAIANAMGDLGKGDIVIVLTFWRLYKNAIRAAHEAKAKGATVCVMTDATMEPLQSACDHLLVAPAESASFFATVVPGMCLIEGISAELAALDPERASRSIARFEEQWRQQDLLYFAAAPMAGKTDDSSWS